MTKYCISTKIQIDLYNVLIGRLWYSLVTLEAWLQVKARLDDVNEMDLNF